MEQRISRVNANRGHPKEVHGSIESAIFMSHRELSERGRHDQRGSMAASTEYEAQAELACLSILVRASLATAVHISTTETVRYHSSTRG